MGFKGGYYRNNRTFVVLKLVLKDYVKILRTRNNRTFVVLK